MATYRVSAAADDAVERSDNTNFTTNPVSSFGVGNYYGRSGVAGNPFWYSGVRFQNIILPKNQIIESATLTLTPRVNFTINAESVSIYANDADSAANFTTDADIIGRVVTTATVAWNVPTSNTQDVPFTSPDIKSVIQEIVDRAGWASGNAIMLILKPTTGTAGDNADCYFYEDSSTKCALLTITTPEGSSPIFFGNTAIA